MCEPLTRRQLLKYSALVAATFPAAKVAVEGWSLAAEAQEGAAVPMHLELVTVTDTSAVVTWFTGDPTRPDEFGRPAPVAAPGRVLIGTSPDPTSWIEVGAHGPTPYHYVEITGLERGTTYWYRAESSGVPAIGTTHDLALLADGLGGPVPRPPDPSNLGVFTTLVPPPGAELARVAWFNDVHIGEHVSGLAYSNDALPGGGFPPGFAADPDDPYWRIMATASIAEARARGCTVMLANGDLTNEAEPDEVAEARRLLDAFGRLGAVDERLADGARLLRPGHAPAYYVTRGNHDRVHDGETWAACPPNERFGGVSDCFRDGFDASFDPGSSHWALAVGSDTHRFRFVGLDSNDAGGAGRLPAEELEFLEAHLAAGDATIPMFHHIVGDAAVATAIPPLVFGVDDADARAFRALLAGRDNVAGVYNGHTHRNNRTTATETGSIPFFEGGAVKEYPGGYTVVRLFEGGYMVNFYKAAEPEARAWSERSRGEYLGLYPYYTLGTLSDRNWVYEIDARVRHGAQPAPSPTDGPAPEPTPSSTTEPPAGGGPGPDLPATGGGAAAVLGGAAALTAGLAAVRQRRRPRTHVNEGHDDIA